MIIVYNNLPLREDKSSKDSFSFSCCYHIVEIKQLKSDTPNHQEVVLLRMYLYLAKHLYSTLFSRYSLNSVAIWARRAYRQGLPLQFLVYVDANVSRCTPFRPNILQTSLSNPKPILHATKTLGSENPATCSLPCLRSICLLLFNVVGFDPKTKWSLVNGE